MVAFNVKGAALIVQTGPMGIKTFHHITNKHRNTTSCKYILVTFFLTIKLLKI